MASGTVKATVNYIKELPIYNEEKPFQILMPIPPDAEDQRTSNIEFEKKEQIFNDIRGQEDQFGLDDDGFQIVHSPTALHPFDATNQDFIKTRYLPEVDEILRRHVPGGFDRVLFFDWRVRDAAILQESPEIDMNDLSRSLRTVGYVHIDHAPRSVVLRVQLYMGDEADHFLSGRVRVINVWRPLEHEVEDQPLAYCSAPTLSQTDLVECDHVRRQYKGATLYPYFNPEQKWYYLSNQSPDEVTLLKIFDSSEDVKANTCAHCAFQHPLSTPSSKKRKSIEIRCLIFNYPDSTTDATPIE
ncbi:methyltransferase CmcJ [Nemania sp. FL0031]|nr:methyltransferase CmcJ [Nemania sp. FL0031]